MYRQVACGVHQVCREMLQQAKSPTIHQTRNTFKLKRQHTVNPITPHKHRPVMKPRHYIYDFVENTNNKPRPPIEAILTQNVDGIGLAGRKVTVPRKLFRNELFPLGQAVYPSTDNIEKYKVDEQPEVPKEEQKLYTRMTLRQLKGMYLAIPMNADNPWVLNATHVKVAFRKIGAVVPEEAITLPREPITQPTDGFFITVTVNREESVEIKTMVYHVSREPGKCTPPDLPSPYAITSPHRIAKLKQKGEYKELTDR